MTDDSLKPQSPNSEIDDFSDRLQKFITTIKEETGVPGICLALNIGGHFIEVSTGTLSIDNSVPICADSHFQLGCITKVLTAMLSAKMIESGELDPDHPIENYLEELHGTDCGKNLTIWHLLSHTGGYRGLNVADPGVAYYFSWPRFVEYLKTAPQLFSPGAVFSYEHSEYVILGEIIKRISRREIIDLYNEVITDPLKITAGSLRSGSSNSDMWAADHAYNPNTRQFTKLKTIPYGDFWQSSLSDLTMSIKDILKVVSTICGINSPPKGMSEKAMAYVKKQVVTLPRTYGSTKHEQIPNTFGFGCAGYRGWILGHNGSARGQTCGMRFDPRNNIAMVIGINAWQPFLRDSIINYVFGALRGKAIPTPADKVFEPSLDDLVGTYIGPQGQEIIVTSEKGRIACALKTPSAKPIVVQMQKNERGYLEVCSDTLHYSLGFFKEPDSDVAGAMLGLFAFRKQ